VLHGDAFVFRSGSDGKHLWVVVSDPLSNSNEVLILNLTTVRNVPFEDQSCVFNPGEHPWIVDPSYIAYDYARVVTSAYLDRLENGTSVKMHPPFATQLLQRIYAGGEASQNFEIGYLQILQDQGLV
jgi:hypothetical protein